MRTRAPWRAAGSGRIVRPSSSSVASTPHRRSSATSDPMRSVSFRRMNPTPRMRVGESAKEATAASVGTVSDQSAMSTSMPFVARPSTAIEPAVRSTRAPIRPSRSTKAASPCNGVGPNPGTTTRPPVMAAAAHRYEAEDASGSIG